MPVIKNPTTVIKSGGGEDKLAYRISNLGNYTYENNEITDLKRMAFYYDANLTEIRCGNVSIITNQAFSYCSYLISASFPSATTIGEQAFYYCARLATISFPLVRGISNSAFDNCRALISASFPSATTISGNAFNNCSSLTSVSFPLITTISGNTFSGCSQLVSISFPSATRIVNNAFNNCSSLTSVSFPSATRIDDSAFKGCTQLTSITLGTSQVCVLGSTNVFPASATQHINIYVPINLIASYRTATNWSTLYNNGYISILPIDGQLINTSITNGTFSGPVAIANNGTATITITANSGYELPTSVSVTGASYTYSNGVITLSNPTAEVNISATCPQATPSGYNLEITSGGSIGSGSDSNAYIKLNGYATRASDYDYYIVPEGLYGTPSKIYNNQGVLQSNPLNLTQISSIQIWGDSNCDYELNNSGDVIEVSGFNNRVMINLTQDSTIEIAPYIED